MSGGKNEVINYYLIFITVLIISNKK